MAWSWEFRVWTKLLTTQGVLIPSFEKSVSKKAWFLVHPVWKLNIKRDYGEKSKGLEVFTTADVLFWAQGRKALPSWGAVTSLRYSSESRKRGQDQSDIYCSKISGVNSNSLGWIWAGKFCLFPGQPEPAYHLGCTLGRHSWDKEPSAFHIQNWTGKLFAFKLNQWMELNTHTHTHTKMH